MPPFDRCCAERAVEVVVVAKDDAGRAEILGSQRADRRGFGPDRSSLIRRHCTPISRLQFPRQVHDIWIARRCLVASRPRARPTASDVVPTRSAVHARASVRQARRRCHVPPARDRRDREPDRVEPRVPGADARLPRPAVPADGRRRALRARSPARRDDGRPAADRPHRAAVPPPAAAAPARLDPARPGDRAGRARRDHRQVQAAVVRVDRRTCCSA